ncbi:2-dehydro-3-deoxygalactonokinase [Pseudoroseomonas cervicalis]|uniref:2-dehydro-3-deoxygalactonokinase n=1 Tax=Teichococcus cervicalis TaxID=204525 RepID=UPI0022F1C6F7|nr:2-dehydro-3-deoxygalactonokinase [Pseudoroseomonas cervicalis]WBV42570.1 2-dehydro-3-deoxygalactonokinase [Pseudoroseomonas cervicalis]
MPHADPVLIALDWGSSSLRAFLMGAAGEVLAQREGGPGITALPQPGAEGFAAAFTAECGAWLARWPGLPVVAGGMVGSAQGWREAPYVECPADLGSLARAAVAVAAPGARILIAPGVLSRAAGAEGVPDVMRGEEIQLAGALALRPALRGAARCILPGTHSKWVSLEAGRITGFATHMTGELFAVLRRHSLLGRLMPEAPAAPALAAAGFARGLRLARSGGPGALPHQLFAARSLGLTGEMPSEALADFLSGLLIGHELLAGLAEGVPPGVPLALIGEAGLCRRYAAALAAFGAPEPLLLGNTAPAGLFGFAAAAGLVAPATPAQEIAP